MWDPVPRTVLEEVAYRTPGFCGWQQEHWWTHCGDAAQFIGRAGRKELQALGPQAIAAIQASAGLADGPEWDQFLSSLDKDDAQRRTCFGAELWSIGRLPRLRLRGRSTSRCPPKSAFDSPTSRVDRD